MPENHELSLSELLNKRVVLFTLCGIAWMLCFVFAYLAVKQLPIPDPLDRLVTFLLGNVSGVLVNTGLTRAANSVGSDSAKVPVSLGDDVVKVESVPDAGDGEDVTDEPAPSVKSARVDPLSKGVQKSNV